MKQIALILIVLICHSCGTTKEMRRSNRAAKKLERLVEKFPELKRQDTILTKIEMKTPKIEGVIIQPGPGYVQTLYATTHEIITLPADLTPFTIPFNDNVINALFTFNGTDYILDYTVKPIPIDTTITTITKTIQPVEHIPIPLTWWQITLMVLGCGVILGIIGVIMFLILRAII